MKTWYLLHYRYRVYQRVMQRLAGMQIAFYCPMFVSVKTRTDRSSIRFYKRPLFSGYLFVHLDIESTQLRSIREIREVYDLVRAGGRILPVPDAVIANIRQLQPHLISVQQTTIWYLIPPEQYEFKLAIYRNAHHFSCGEIHKDLLYQKIKSVILSHDAETRAVKLLSLIESIA